MGLRARTRRRALPALAMALGLVLGVAGCLATAPPAQEFGGLPQETGFYSLQPEAELAADPDFQKEQMARFLARLLEPWGVEPAVPSAEEVHKAFQEIRAKGGYGENLGPRQASWYDEMWLQAGLDAYPGTAFRAISLVETDLRALPTARPVFDGPDSGSGGYPFDRLQHSRVAPGTPLLVLHLSRDGRWALVNCHYTWGWMPSRDLAKVHGEHIKAWSGGRFAAVIKDGTVLQDDKGRTLARANLGAVFPLIGQKFNEVQVLAAAGEDDGWAVMGSASLRADQAVAMPMVLSARNVALLADQLLGQPYGWGGYLGNRDCSALVKDLYAPFGLWLPRNSVDQARQGGRYLSLGGLAAPDRDQALQGGAPPFLSLLWAPGHIMIHLGRHSGQTAVLHSVWGSRGRVVGRVVISPLPEASSRVEGLVVLVPPERLRPR